MSLQTSEIRLPPFHAKQQFAFDSKALRQLYGGATRGGKSAFVKLALIQWCARIPGLQCDIFRLNFDDVIANYMDGEFSFPILLNQWERDGLVVLNKTEVRFWNSSLISLEHCSSDKAMSKHQGIDKHVRVFDEAAQIPERRMKWLTGWVTMSNDMLQRVPEEWRGMFPKVIYLSNPIGPSAGYFRREFVKARPKGEIGEVNGINYQYIPAKVADNPSVNAQDTINRVKDATDEATADALLNENWDAAVGDFIREFDERRHVVKDFTPPQHWFKFRGFDWGHSEPFSVLWAAVSDGEDFIDERGNRRWFRRGCVVIYREWHGCREEQPSYGLELPNREIARGIVERTREVTSGVTITDSLPFQNRGGILMAEEFAQNGVLLTRGNTERIVGWARVKDYLKGIDDDPMLVICESCTYLRDYLPALQRHKTKMEDAVEDGEATHSCDTLRLIIMTRQPIKSAPPLPQKIERAKLTPKRIISMRKTEKRKFGIR